MTGGVPRLDLVVEPGRPVGSEEVNVVPIGLRVGREVGVGQVDPDGEVGQRAADLGVVDGDRLAPGRRTRRAGEVDRAAHHRGVGRRHRRVERHAEVAVGHGGVVGPVRAGDDEIAPGMRSASTLRTAERMARFYTARGARYGVRKAGVEPARFYPQEPESCASASSATFAKIGLKTSRNLRDCQAP